MELFFQLLLKGFVLVFTLVEYDILAGQPRHFSLLQTFFEVLMFKSFVHAKLEPMALFLLYLFIFFRFLFSNNRLLTWLWIRTWFLFNFPFFGDLTIRQLRWLNFGLRTRLFLKFLDLCLTGRSESEEEDEFCFLLFYFSAWFQKKTSFPKNRLVVYACPLLY